MCAVDIATIQAIEMTRNSEQAKMKHELLGYYTLTRTIQLLQETETAHRNALEAAKKERFHSTAETSKYSDKLDAWLDHTEPVLHPRRLSKREKSQSSIIKGEIDEVLESTLHVRNNPMPLRRFDVKAEEQTKQTKRSIAGSAQKFEPVNQATLAELFTQKTADNSKYEEIAEEITNHSGSELESILESMNDSKSYSEDQASKVEIKTKSSMNYDNETWDSISSSQHSVDSFNELTELMAKMKRIHAKKAPEKLQVKEAMLKEADNILIQIKLNEEKNIKFKEHKLRITQQMEEIMKRTRISDLGMNQTPVNSETNVEPKKKFAVASKVQFDSGSDRSSESSIQEENTSLGETESVQERLLDSQSILDDDKSDEFEDEISSFHANIQLAALPSPQSRTPQNNSTLQCEIELSEDEDSCAIQIQALFNQITEQRKALKMLEQHKTLEKLKVEFINQAESDDLADQIKFAKTSSLAAPKILGEIPDKGKENGSEQNRVIPEYRYEIKESGFSVEKKPDHLIESILPSQQIKAAGDVLVEYEASLARHKSQMIGTNNDATFVGATQKDAESTMPRQASEKVHADEFSDYLSDFDDEISAASCKQEIKDLPTKNSETSWTSQPRETENALHPANFVSKIANAIFTELLDDALRSTESHKGKQGVTGRSTATDVIDSATSPGASADKVVEEKSQSFATTKTQPLLEMVSQHTITRQEEMHSILNRMVLKLGELLMGKPGFTESPNLPPFLSLSESGEEIDCLVYDCLQEAINDQFEAHRIYSHRLRPHFKKDMFKPRPITYENMLRKAHETVGSQIDYELKHDVQLDPLLISQVKEKGKEYLDMIIDEAEVQVDIVDSIWNDVLNETTLSLHRIYSKA